jgi:hypothetical protein
LLIDLAAFLRILFVYVDSASTCCSPFFAKPIKCKNHSLRDVQAFWENGKDSIGQGEIANGSAFARKPSQMLLLSGAHAPIWTLQQTLPNLSVLLLSSFSMVQ